MLSTICNDPSDWPNALWKIQQSYNTTIQKSTGFSPLHLLIGVDANIPPVQARLDDVLVDNNRQNPINIEANRETARQRLLQIENSFKKRFDATRRNNIYFNVGDIVFVSQNHRHNDKLAPKFKGPYEISSIPSNDRYALQGIGTLRNITVAKEKLRFWPGELINVGMSG